MFDTRLALPGRAIYEAGQVLLDAAAAEGLQHGAPVTMSNGVAKLAAAPGPVAGILVRPRGAGLGQTVEPGERVQVITAGLVLLLLLQPLAADATAQLWWEPAAGWWWASPAPGRLNLQGPWLVETPCSAAGQLAVVRLQGGPLLLA